MGECEKLAEVIRVYEKASGQRITLEKSELSFSSNLPIVVRREISERLRVKEVAKHEKYLGLPTLIGRSKKAIFEGIKDRMWKKLNGWKEKLLA